jgi:glycosyltransferase involved in cell wall biosynthesis
MVAACPFPCERGTPLRIHRLAEALCDQGHEVHIVTYHLGEPIEVRGPVIHRIARIPTYRRLAPGPTTEKLFVLDPLLAWKLARVLRERRFDIIHAHHLEGLITALLARPRGGCPIVFDAHTLAETELPFYGNASSRWIMRRVGFLLDRTMPRRADHVIAVTDGIRDRLVALGAADPDRIAVISNGVEYEVFERAPHRAAEAPDQRTLVFAGNLAAFQGVEHMLRAFALLRSRRCDARLMIVSRTPFDRYESLARELGIRDAIEIVATGFEQVPGRLAMSDIALNPRSGVPGLPQKTLNYMAAGLPIVSFATSGKHLIDGQTALLVSDGDIESFVAAIERLLDDPDLAARLGASAKALVRSFLSWEQSALRVDQVYVEAIAARSHRGRVGAPPSSGT